MHIRSAILRLCAVVALVAGVAASETDVTAQQLPAEDLQIPLGAVLEILAQASGTDTRYAWTLSLDGIFLQADRSRSFRTRFSQPGKYRLNTEISRPSGSLRKAFVISVREDSGSIPEPAAIATFTPQDTEPASLTLPEGKSLVLITRDGASETRALLDADTSVDENGDGHTGNDDSAAETYFSSNGLPLWLWITEDLPRSFSVLEITEGETRAKQFTVLGGGSAASASASSVMQASFSAEDRGKGLVRFSYDPASAGAGTVALALWDFGDGTQSMEDAPLHRYSASGTYSVRLQITDLRNGTVTHDTRRDVTVVVTTTTVTAQGASASSQASSDATMKTESRARAGMLQRALPVVLGGIGAVIVGILIVVLIAFLRKKHGSLQQTLERADRKMAIDANAKTSAVAGETEPLRIADADEQDPAEETSVEKATPDTPEVLGPAPAWLQPVSQPSVAAPPASVAPAMTETAPQKSPSEAPVVPPVAPLPPFPVGPEPQDAPPLAPVATETSSPIAPPSQALPPEPALINPPKPPVEIQGAKPEVEALRSASAPARETPANQAEAAVPKPKAPATQSSAENGDLPEWLKPKPTSTPPKHPAPSIATASSPGTQQPPSPVVPTPPALSDKEREHRRLKRQRYRLNRRQREQSKGEAKPQEPAAAQVPAPEEAMPAADAPVAFVRADGLAPKPQSNGTEQPAVQ
ncbi:PKD domain-containing protein [Candidatus Peribacteria bacterium]|nr:PKD domain-containing protein [Candidatus Peribacteria bacterium]